MTDEIKKQDIITAWCDADIAHNRACDLLEAYHKQEMAKKDAEILTLKAENKRLIDGLRSIKEIWGEND